MSCVPHKKCVQLSKIINEVFRRWAQYYEFEVDAIFKMKNGAEAPIFLTDICSMSCVNEIVQHKLFNAVADGIHTARPFEVIGDSSSVTPSISAY